MKEEYKAQVALLLDILPHIAKEKCFALKGGTAINMFVWDMPRLSVDIDLTYLPIEPRNIAFENISESLERIKCSIIKILPGIRIEASSTEKQVKDKLFCALGNTKIKIEVNTTMRGFIYPPRLMKLSPSVQQEYKRFSAIQVISYPELFGGKICAALDRQHPRDLFDVFCLMNEGGGGITEEIKQGFISALLSHNRPINELLNSKFINQEELFIRRFLGMSLKPFSYADLDKTHRRLVKIIQIY